MTHHLFCCCTTGLVTSFNLSFLALHNFALHEAGSHKIQCVFVTVHIAASLSLQMTPAVHTLYVTDSHITWKLLENCT